MGLRGAQDGPTVREVAELRDGRRITGSLDGGPEGSVVFRPESGSEAIAADRLARVQRLVEDGRVDPVDEPRPFQLAIGRDQRLSGRLIEVDGDAIRLEAGPGSGPLRVDRHAVASLIQRPGEALVVSDRFESDEPQESWTLGRGAEITPRTDDEGAALALRPGGSEARLRLPDPVEAGRVEVSFLWEEGRAAGQRWFADLIFDGPNGEEVTRVVLGWQDEFPSVESRGGPEIVVQPLILEPGWHRLAVRFGPGRTLLTIDGDDLGRGGGPRGSLASLRFRTEAARDAEAPGELSARLDDLLVSRSFEPTTNPEVDPTQDEMRLVSGDQVWGSVVSADEQGVRMEVLGRTIEAPWSQVAGLYFERRATPAGPLSGQWVRVEWEVGDPESRPDRVEGIFESVSPEGYRVEVPYVGPVTVPRDRLRQIQFLERGRRQVIDPHSRHLGDQLMPELDPPWPDGDEHEVRFEIEEVPGAPIRLVIDAVHVEGMFAGGRFTEELRAGYQRTNLLLNGEPLDFLNRHVADSNRTPARLVIAVEPDRLRVGENLLRFEQMGREKDPSYRDDLGLLRILLEWPDAAPSTAP